MAGRVDKRQILCYDTHCVPIIEENVRKGLKIMKQMKCTVKLRGLLLACLLLCGLFCLSVAAQDETSDMVSDIVSDTTSEVTGNDISNAVNSGTDTASKLGKTVRVFVTVADGEGKLVLTREEIAVSDENGDGSLTVYDALYCAHEAKFQGGASAGFGAEETQYGLSMTKLWGIANGGSYGYYVNNASAMSLLDEIKEGDRINAFVYTDTTAFSDTYCFFQKDSASVAGKGELTLTLSGAGYDENQNPINTPIAGAVILIDGQETAFVTDEDGKVTLRFDGTGTCVVSAKKDGQTLVPPVCVVNVTADQPLAGDTSLLGWAALATAAVCGLTALHRYKKGADVA